MFKGPDSVYSQCAAALYVSLGAPGLQTRWPSEDKQTNSCNHLKLRPAPNESVNVHHLFSPTIVTGDMSNLASKCPSTPRSFSSEFIFGDSS